LLPFFDGEIKLYIYIPRTESRPTQEVNAMLDKDNYCCMSILSSDLRTWNVIKLQDVISLQTSVWFLVTNS